MLKESLRKLALVRPCEAKDFSRGLQSMNVFGDSLNVLWERRSDEYSLGLQSIELLNINPIV